MPPEKLHPGVGSVGVGDAWCLPSTWTTRTPTWQWKMETLSFIDGFNCFPILNCPFILFIGDWFSMATLITSIWKKHMVLLRIFSINIGFSICYSWKIRQQYPMIFRKLLRVRPWPAGWNHSRCGMAGAHYRLREGDRAERTSWQREEICDREAAILFLDWPCSADGRRSIFWPSCFAGWLRFWGC